MKRFNFVNGFVVQIESSQPSFSSTAFLTKLDGEWCVVSSRQFAAVFQTMKQAQKAAVAYVLSAGSFALWQVVPA
jgi:hypothetical protein